MYVFIEITLYYFRSVFISLKSYIVQRTITPTYSLRTRSVLTLVLKSDLSDHILPAGRMCLQMRPLGVGSRFLSI